MVKQIICDTVPFWWAAEWRMTCLFRPIVEETFIKGLQQILDMK